MAGSGNANMQQFEIYFQRADLDRDGRISGDEAVSFLQGSNLSKQVLAQIWSHADQNHTGYLSRPEFYNALKLVTVAQSKRELTPDIVKAALYGPASAKIPAPQINLANMPASQQRPATVASSPQITASALPSVQNFGFRGPGPSNMSANQQFGPAPAPSVMRPQLNQIQSSSTGPNQLFGLPQSSTATNWQAGRVQPTSLGMNQQLGQASTVTTVNSQFISAQGNQSVRPPVSMATTAALRPSMGAGSPSIPGGGTSVGPSFPTSNTDWFSGKGNLVSSGIIAQGPNKDIPPVMPMASNPLDQFSTISPAVAKDPKASGASGPTSTSDSMFGGDIFSANRPSSPHVSSAQQQHMTVISSATVSPTSGALPSTKPDPFQALQSTIMKPSAAVQASQAPMPKPNQATTQVTSLSSPGISVGVGSSALNQSQFSWPKMARASIQKYGKVFMEVDTDRDGKITGDQARNLFLSWRLPREVLKQVWDLSDQDGDSMLSLREFCIALYLMERYREGRPLPSSLPNSVMLDETLLSLAGPPINYGSMVGGPADLRPQGLAGAQTVVPSGVRPPLRSFAQPDGSGQLNQQNTRAPMTHNVHAKLSNGEDNSMNNTILDAAETDEKVENNEKVLLDSKEKLEFYRSKMQELVLYKSRCDNRLNEITERARADKAEAELLEKKYQEKYKEVAEIHSKLTIEEASFREIQERKMELQHAIIKIEQGGSADGILQVRADRIQSDLEELLKALNDRCKKHNLEIKSAAVIELPPGWVPGIPEVAAIWDEDWDKFEDEVLSFDDAVPVNSKSSSEQRENFSPAPIYPDSPSNAESAPEKPFSTLTSAFDSESTYSADESKSMQGSPRGQTGHDSPSEEYSDKSASKSFDGDSEAQRRSFDEPSWGNFDTNDDVDSVWGFNAKDGDHGKSGDNYFFGSSDFGASPRGKDSPQADSSFKNSPFRFEDSVPGSPLSKAGTSPPRYSVESRDPFFDSFSRYDSFSTHDRGSPPRRENISRFDSISSTSGFDRSKKFSFDDSDPFGSSGPFKVSESPKKASEWSSF